jgi:hypothetical protein
MSTATCVNLLEAFGKDYKVTFDPAYDRRLVPRRCLGPWMMQLPCRGKGVCIYPHGGDRLAVEVDGRPGLAKKLAAIPGVELWQDGTGRKPSCSTWPSSRRSRPSSGPAGGGASRKGNGGRASGGWPGRGRRRPRSDRIGGPGRPRTSAPGLEGHSRPRGRFGGRFCARGWGRSCRP